MHSIHAEEMAQWGKALAMWEFESASMCRAGTGTPLFWVGLRRWGSLELVPGSVGDPVSRE